MVSGTVSAEVNLCGAVTVSTIAQTLGVLYVLEGSALGARLLLRRAEALGMNSKFGARHLALQTAMPTAWPNFLSILEAASLDIAQEAECVGAAIATFTLFERAYGSALRSRRDADRLPIS